MAATYPGVYRPGSVQYHYGPGSEVVAFSPISPPMYYPQPQNPRFMGFVPWQQCNVPAGAHFANNMQHSPRHSLSTSSSATLAPVAPAAPVTAVTPGAPVVPVASVDAVKPVASFATVASTIASTPVVPITAVIPATPVAPVAQKNINHDPKPVKEVSAQKNEESNKSTELDEASVHGQVTATPVAVPKATPECLKKPLDTLSVLVGKVSQANGNDSELPSVTIANTVATFNTQLKQLLDYHSPHFVKGWFNRLSREPHKDENGQLTISSLHARSQRKKNKRPIFAQLREIKEKLETAHQNVYEKYNKCHDEVEARTKHVNHNCEGVMSMKIECNLQIKALEDQIIEAEKVAKGLSCDFNDAGELIVTESALMTYTTAMTKERFRIPALWLPSNDEVAWKPTTKKQPQVVFFLPGGS